MLELIREWIQKNSEKVCKVKNREIRIWVGGKWISHSLLLSNSLLLFRVADSDNNSPFSWIVFFINRNIRVWTIFFQIYSILLTSHKVHYITIDWYYCVMHLVFVLISNSMVELQHCQKLWIQLPLPCVMRMLSKILVAIRTKKPLKDLRRSWSVFVCFFIHLMVWTYIRCHNTSYIWSRYSNNGSNAIYDRV